MHKPWIFFLKRLMMIDCFFFFLFDTLSSCFVYFFFGNQKHCKATYTHMSCGLYEITVRLRFFFFLAFFVKSEKKGQTDTAKKITETKSIKQKPNQYSITNTKTKNYLFIRWFCGCCCCFSLFHSWFILCMEKSEKKIWIWFAVDRKKWMLIERKREREQRSLFASFFILDQHHYYHDQWKKSRKKRCVHHHFRSVFAFRQKKQKLIVSILLFQTI